MGAGIFRIKLSYRDPVSPARRGRCSIGKQLNTPSVIHPRMFTALPFMLLLQGRENVFHKSIPKSGVIYRFCLDTVFPFNK